MNDSLISRQAAVDAVMDELKRIPTSAIRAKTRIEALPSEQPTLYGYNIEHLKLIVEVCGRFICPDCPEWNNEYEDCNKDETYCLDRMDEFFKTHELYKAGRKSYYEIWKCREKAEGKG